MSKRRAATIGGVVAATLLIAGIAWASGSDDSPASTTTPNTSTSLGDTGSSTNSDDNSTSTSLEGVTSTTVDDNTSTSSANTSTSTTIDDNTSSTIDDDDDGTDDRGNGDDENEDRDDNSGKGGDEDDNATAVAEGLHTFDVAGVGDVTVNVVSGALQLVDVQASAGWTIEVDKAQVDRIKIKFRNGESEAEFEAELEHGGIKVEVEAAS